MAINFLNVGAFPDNVKLTFGAGSDLQIFHNATDSIIYNGTGALMLRGSDVRIQAADASSTYLTLDSSEATFTTDIRLPASGKLYTWTGGNDNYLTYNSWYIWTGSDIIIRNSSTGPFKFQTNGANDVLTLDSSQNATFAGNVDVNGTEILIGGADSRLAENQLRFNSAGAAYIDHGTTSQSIKFRLSNSSALDVIPLEITPSYLAVTGNIVAGADSTYNLGSSGVRWASAYVDGLSVLLTATIGGDLQIQSDLTVLNKGQTAYLDLATRDTSGSEVVYNLSNIGTINGGSPTTGGPYLPLAGGTMTGNVIFNDSVQIRFGTSGAESYIYSDGSDTYYQGNSGNLWFYQAADDKDIIFSCDDGSGGVTTYITLDGSEGYTVAYKNIRFDDNVSALFGTSGDMTIKHDGSNSKIENNTGHLNIIQEADNKKINFYNDDGSGGTTEYLIIDGSAEYISIKKNTVRPDSVYTYWGDANDFYIGHDSTNTNLINSTGHLYIANYSDDKDIIFQSDDGSGGVTAYLTIDGGAEQITIYKDVEFQTSVRAYFGSSSNMQIWHDGNNGSWQNDTGNIYIRNTSNDGDIIFLTDDGSGGYTAYLTLDGSQTNIHCEVDFRIYDSKKLQLGNSADAEIYHNGSDAFYECTTGDMYFINKADDKDIVFQSDDGSGGYTTYLALDGSSKRIDIPDSIPLCFGAADDLQVQHNGSSSYIQNYTGDLIIQNAADDARIRFQCDDGAGGTASYFDLVGSQAIAGTPPTLFTQWYDDSRITLGNGLDFQMWHDGTNTKFYNQTGDLKVGVSGTFAIQNSSYDENIATFTKDGAVQLFYDSSKKFETTTLGVTIHGNLNLNDNGHLHFGADNDLDIYHSGTDSYITDSGTGDLFILGSEVILGNGVKKGVRVVADGMVQLRHNDATKLWTEATGVQITGTLTLSGKGTSAATVAGDGSTTLTTKGYVDSLITGATLYQGTWDPSSGTYGNPDLSTASLQVNGYYYICSANGSATPNGAGTEPDSWHTGDWVIWNDDLGASGQWQKIDNTTVLSGAGTGDYLARWTDAETLGDSVLQASGSDILMPQYIKHTGDTDTYFGFPSNDTFTVYTAAGEGLNIDSNRAVTLTGTLKIPDKLEHAGDTNTYLDFSAADNLKLYAGGKIYFHAHDNGNLYLSSNNSTALTLDTSQTATFAGAVTFTGGSIASNTIALNTGNNVLYMRGGSAGLLIANGDGSDNYYITTSDHRWEVGGSAAMRLDSTGLGIGTTSPGNKLHIVSGDEDTLRLEATSGQPAIFWYPDGSVKWEERASASTWQLYSYDESEWVFNLYNGKCGIGTITPSEKLHVSTESNTVAKFESTDGNANIRVSDTQDNAHLGTVDGKTFIGPDTSTGGNNITILSNGKVGIGDANPAAKLEVSGGIIAGGKTMYTLDYSGGLNTTGNAVAGLSTGSNGHSAVFIFTCSGGDGYQRIIYSCKNVSGTWDIDKDIDEGVNAFDVTYAADGSDNITFTFKARSSTQSYWPKVTVEAMGNSIQTSYIN